MRHVLAVLVVLALACVVYLPKVQAGHKSKSWTKVVTSGPGGVSTSETVVEHRVKRGQFTTKWKTFTSVR